MIDIGIIIGITGILSSIIGGIIGLFLSKTIFKKKLINIKNAIDLLKKGKVDLWNEIRVKSQDWNPVLDNLDLSNKNLQDVNFKNTSLKSTKLRNSNLDGCDFNNANLENADISGCSLRGTIFTNTNLKGEKIKNVLLERTDFQNSNLKNTILPDNFNKIIEKEIITLKDIKDNPELIDKIAPYEFEVLVSDLFKRMGYETSLISQNKDKGYDIELIKKDKLDTIKYLVEIKKYKKERLISLSIIRSLLGSLIISGIPMGILVATTGVTKNALDFIKSQKLKNIKIIDREKLLELINTHVS